MTTPVPRNPKIYHITHVDNLPRIVAEGGLWSDAAILQRGGPTAMIGMGKLKRRRLEELAIDALGGVMVGECVPFYFCPRSVMLFLIHQRNPEVAFKGGQGPIVHLEAELHEALAWATAQGQPWAFSLSNAASRYTEFRTDAGQLHEIDWAAVAASNWAGRQDKKAAEFLVKDFFPWELFRVVGVQSAQMVEQATRALQGASHQPLVQYRPGWYY